MSCTKHIQRKRPGSCPDCAAELTIDESTIKEVESPKPEKKKEDPKPVEKEDALLTPTPIDSSLVFKECSETIDIDAFDKKITELFENKFKEYVIKLRAVTNISYEHLAIPYGRCGLPDMLTLEQDGFRLVNFYKAEIAKISGFKEDVAVFERVKQDVRKKSIEKWKEKYENKK